MYKNIMVALDGSVHGKAALDQATLLARRLSGHLHGVHVVDTAVLRGSILHDLSGSLGLEPQLHLTSRVESFMNELADEIFKIFEARCEENNLQYHKTRQTGDVAESLADAAELAEVIVLGKRGAAFDADDRRGEGHGSVHRLMKVSTTPMMIVGTKHSDAARPVLYYDASPGARRALIDATRLASTLDVPLTVCHVRPDEADNLEGPLMEAKRFLDPYGLSTDFVELDGTLPHVLSQFIESRGHDLLVLGYQRGGGFMELFGKHMPDLMLHRVSCPLWVSK